MTVKVREALPHEIDRVGDLTVLAYLDGDALYDDEADYVHALRDASGRAQSASLLVAELDGEVVGTVTITPVGSTWSEIAVPGELEFRMLAVDPSVRRQGVAEALLQACIRQASVHGDQQVVISVLDTNDAAIRFYEKHGFSRVPSRDWDPVPGLRLLVFALPVMPGHGVG